MKRILVVAAAIVFLAPGLAEAQAISLGLRGGYTRAKVDVQEEGGTEFRWRNGFLVGGIVRAPMTPTFAIQTGASFVRKGGELLAENGFVTMDLDYVSVPVLGVLRAGSSGPWGLRLMGGPVVSFELSCALSGEVEGATADGLDCDQGGIETKTVDFGVHLGGGLVYGLSSGASLVLDAGYELGLLNLNQAPREGETAENRAFVVNVGVDLPVG